MADEHHVVPAQRHNLQLAVFAGKGDQPHVNHVAQHVIINLIGAAIFHVHVDCGIGLEKSFDVGRQIVQADAVNRGHPNRAGDDVLDFLEPAVKRLESLDDLFAVFIKHLALAREPELFLAAFDQQRFELALQRADLLADRGLGDLVDLRRLGETFRLRQVTEDLQALDLHGRIEGEKPGGVN